MQAGNDTGYTWDAQDRLVSASVPGGSASYQYDQDGRRVRQTQATSTTHYLWDELSAYGDVVAETDASYAPQTYYTVGGTELISQKRGASLPEYLRFDGHSGTRNLTSCSGGISQSYIWRFWQLTKLYWNPKYRLPI